MKNDFDFTPYRKEIGRIDLTHHALILVTILVMLWLCYMTHSTNDNWYALWVPPFVITLTGLLARNDTMVHRLGGFLKANGDPWELAKANHTPTKILMPISDALIMVPAIGMLAYSEYCATKWFVENKIPLDFEYLLVTVIFVFLGIIGWIYAAANAGKGFEAGGKNNAIDQNH